MGVVTAAHATKERVFSAVATLSAQAAQSDAHFPAFAENYARYLRLSLGREAARGAASAIVKLLSSGASSDRCGFQPLKLADAELVRESERWLTEGRFEPFLKAKEKYEEFAARLRDEPGFRRDWRAVRKAFPRETASKKILHRTLVPERNWVRDGGAKFRTRAQRFQAVFDLLCWKYCLWGVGRGRPLLLKPSVVYTPHGTQIFIPAYMSFDAKRDLDLGLITRLHRARGQQRQGTGFSTARLERESLRRQAREADRAAREQGLRGEARYAFIGRQIGRAEFADPRAIRALLTKSKRTTRQTSRARGNK